MPKSRRPRRSEGTGLAELDEVTSFVDFLTEDRIEQILAQIYKTPTMFATAHRLFSIRWTSYDTVLDAGKVAETGTHAKLARPGVSTSATSANIKSSPDRGHTTIPRTSHETASGTLTRSCLPMKW